MKNTTKNPNRTFRMAELVIAIELEALFLTSGQTDRLAFARGRLIGAA